MTDKLVAWLRAQIERDRENAKQWHELECSIQSHLRGSTSAVVAASRMYAAVPGAVCNCGGPERMLREISAKHTTLDHALRNMHPHAPSPWRDVLYALAAVYADRHGYEEAIKT